MDEVAEYNAGRWRALAEARALFTRPLLDLDARTPPPRLIKNVLTVLRRK